MLFQLLLSTHPSRIIRLDEMPEFFRDSVTDRTLHQQLQPGRVLQQEIDVRKPVMARLKREANQIYYTTKTSLLGNRQKHVDVQHERMTSKRLLRAVIINSTKCI